MGSTWPEPPAGAKGKFGVDILIGGKANARLVLGSDREANCALGNRFVDGAVGAIRIGHRDGSATGRIDVSVVCNDFSVTTLEERGGLGNYPQGGLILRSFGSEQASLHAEVSHNRFRSVSGADGIPANIAVFFDATPGSSGGTGQVTISNNELLSPINRPFEIISESSSRGAVRLESNRIAPGEATFPGSGSYEVPFYETVVTLKPGARLDLGVAGHTFPTPSDSSAPGLSVVVQERAELCLELSDNRSSSGYRLTGEGTIRVFRGASGSDEARQVVLDSNESGAGVELEGAIELTSTPCRRPEMEALR